MIYLKLYVEDDCYDTLKIGEKYEIGEDELYSISFFYFNKNEEIEIDDECMEEIKEIYEECIPSAGVDPYRYLIILGKNDEEYSIQFNNNSDDNNFKTIHFVYEKNNNRIVKYN